MPPKSPLGSHDPLGREVLDISYYLDALDFWLAAPTDAIMRPPILSAHSAKRPCLINTIKGPRGLIRPPPPQSPSPPPSSHYTVRSRSFQPSPVEVVPPRSNYALTSDGASRVRDGSPFVSGWLVEMVGNDSSVCILMFSFGCGRFCIRV